MTWAQRLLRFVIEINQCVRCSGKRKVMVSIEEPEIMARILVHIQKNAPDARQTESPLGARVPRQQARLI
jgi:hypothetical protein